MALSNAPSFTSSRPSRNSQGASVATSSQPGQILTPPSYSYTSPSKMGAVSPQAFPDNLRCLSVPEVGECLRKLNMGEHVERFKSDLIDGEKLITLDEAMLPDLGVSNKLKQRKLLMFIKGWRPNMRSPLNN
ncbi:GRB2-associated and regulator of MAPK protein-like [Oculina patagonica]